MDFVHDAVTDVALWGEVCVHPIAVDVVGAVVSITMACAAANVPTAGRVSVAGTAVEVSFMVPPFSVRADVPR